MAVTTPSPPASTMTTERRSSTSAQLIWYSALLLALYLPVIVPMVREWGTEEEMGHGFFVPVLVGYFIWLRRDELMATPVKPEWWPVGLVVWGFIQSVLGFLGSEFFVSRTGFLLAVVGVVWTLCGRAMIAKLLFPLALSAFMIRIPALIYGQVTFPLQLFASAVAEKALWAMGVPVLRNGNVLELADHSLSVVEACSGIRSLLSLTFLSLVYGALTESRVWMRAALFVVTIPIAILANASRVTITGLLYQYKPEYAEGFYHSLEGWVVFMIATAALLAVHQVLRRVTRMTHGEA